MKSTLLAFVLHLALSTQPFQGSAGPSPEHVIDTAGKKVRAGANYYLRPVRETPCEPRDGPCLAGSGFVPIARSANETCPLNVVAVEGFRGFSVTFTPVNPKKGVIRVSTDQNIKFSLNTSCSQSTVWKLDNFDASTGQWFVTTGGVVGNPGRETVDNWFKIEKYESDYKLVYCPSVCQYCKVLCKDVGVYRYQNGNQRVALTDVPSKVRFESAA